MDSKREHEFISLVTEITFLASSKDWDSEVASLFTQLLLWSDGMFKVIDRIYAFNPKKMELVSLVDQIDNLFNCEIFDSVWNLLVSLFTQIISLVSSMDLDLQQPKAESELISLIKQIVSLFNSKPDSESESELELVSLITKIIHLDIPVDLDSMLLSLTRQLVSLKPKSELTSLIRPIISSFRSMNWEPLQLISLCPQVEVELEQGKLCGTTGEEVQPRETKKGKCSLRFVKFFRSTGINHFHCGTCNGEDHKEDYETALVEVKHPLHPKHYLRLIDSIDYSKTRKCYCCDEDLNWVFYYCSACDYAMNAACVKKQPLLSIRHLKRHEHPLALFPRHTSLTCDICAETDSSCPFYICPPCDFVVHQSCISLPLVIRISRHRHRISFTPSFSRGDWSCGVCRKKINNNYGGYSCIKDGCSYAAHSRCATQSNVWDGLDLEGVPEEIEENVEPFLRISDGIIQHSSHQHHHLRLHENMGRDYDEDKQCQACLTPVYVGNFYSCMQCEFILHESCASLSHKIHHPIHPHVLTLVGRYDGVVDYHDDKCSACAWMCTDCFFYKCEEKECRDFKLHVQCATISEPLVHASHMHPLFLTSKPGEKRRCSVCKGPQRGPTYKYVETFNCLVQDFALCFVCATLPQKVRYKHDKHLLALSYGKETGTMMNWCEYCEGEINLKVGFYKCDEYCGVILHIECMLGRDLYLKSGSSFLCWDKKVDVLPNNQHMFRPFCVCCKKRCLYRVFFQHSGYIFCSFYCMCA